MSKLIIFCGLGGTGKTTLSQIIGQKLNLVCLHKDSLKEFLHEDLRFTTSETYKLFYKVSEEQIENQANIILEATFHFPGDIEKVNHWTQKYALDTYWIFCTTKNSVRLDRMKNRQRHFCHAPGDIKNIKDINLSKNLDDKKMLGKVLKLNTEQNQEKSILEIIEFLK